MKEGSSLKEHLDAFNSIMMDLKNVEVKIEDEAAALSKYIYSLFTKKFDKVFIALMVYVDDIAITRNDLSEIEKFKLLLKSKFQIKDLGKLKYFIGIEIMDNDDGICLSKRKYCLELLHKYGLLAPKHADTHLPENTNLKHIESDDFS
ncbi:ribonuclease H-like domain-containing protein [Tanacetum coccineum]